MLVKVLSGTVLFAVLFCSVRSRSLYSFYSNNTCGCWTEDLFYDIGGCGINQPECLTDDINVQYKALEAQDINCSKWFLKGYDVKLTNHKSGRYNVSLFLSPFSERLRYRVDLKILDSSKDNISFIPLLPNHSTRYVELPGNPCDSVLRLEFHFLYSGTYQLEVGLDSGPQESQDIKCSSKPFQVFSSYKKRKLNDLKPYASSRYRAQQRELVFISNFGKFSPGHQPFGTVVMLKSNIDMSLSDCAGSGNEIAKYFITHKGRHNNVGCCDCYQQAGEKEICQGDTYGESYCPCKWDDEILKCTFSNMTAGNYCIVLEFIDARCKYDTIWIKESPCRWSYNESINNTSYQTEKQMAFVVGDSKLHWLITIPILLIGVALCVLLVRLKPKCLKKLTQGISSYSPTGLITWSERSPISRLMHDEYEKFIYPEILLLYPRDCETFMDAMSSFRAHLRSLDFKVHDPLDEDIYDEVAQSYETWALPFIKNSNVKIILVLSECSKKYEKAFLENQTLEFAQPKLLDKIFPLALSVTHQYFCKRFDSYQRIFVVQLEGSPPMTFDFITPSTVYSIPKNIGALLSDVTNGKLKSVSYPKSLQDSAADYECFCSEHHNYLSELFCSEKLTGS